MNQSYQLTIYQHGKLMDNFQTSSLQPLQDMRTLLGYLQSHDNLSFELYQVIEDTRFLMQKMGQYSYWVHRIFISLVPLIFWDQKQHQ